MSPSEAPKHGPQPEATIAMFVARRMIEGIAQVGVPREEALAAIGITEEVLQDPEARIPRSRLERGCELALQHPQGDPALGLHWARHQTERTFEPVSYLLAHAATLRQAFQLLTRFEQLYGDEPIVALSVEGDLGVVRMAQRPGRSPDVQRMAAELGVKGFVGIVASYGGAESVRRVCFDYPAPAYHAEYEGVMGRAVHFDAPFSGVVFDAGVLDRPLSSSDADIRSALISVAERRLLRATRSAPFSLRVRDFLSRHMPERMEMATTARKLGVSERSLRTRLAEEGTSFRDVQRAVLKAFAESLLRDKGLTIQQAADAMGFSGPDTFHRAFKRWTGVTPGELDSRE